MIKTLKDLNQAGRRFWSGANAKTKDAVPPGMEKCPNCGGFGRKYGETCSVCHGKGFVPEGSDFGTDDDLYDRIKAVSEGGINSKQRELLGYARGALSSGNRVSARKYLEQALAAEDSAQDSIQTVAQTVAKELMSTGEKIKEIERRTGCTTEQAKQALAAVDSVRDLSTNHAEIEAAAKKAKAAGKSKEEFVAGYSGGAAETAARVWAKDASGLAQEIKDILSKEGPMRLQGLRSELEANGWDVNQDNILMELRAIGAKQKYVQGLGNTWSIS